MSSPTAVDTNGNYAPVLRHPDPLSDTVNLGTGEVLSYSGSPSDPTTEGVFPVNLTGDAVCYPRSGSGPTYNWSSSLQAWE